MEIDCDGGSVVGLGWGQMEVACEMDCDEGSVVGILIRVEVAERMVVRVVI